MKQVVLFVVTLILGAPLQANMPYLGPADAPLGGQLTGRNVRVLRENLTADLRLLPGGNVHVTAQYKLWVSGETGIMHFLFIASSSQPVQPDIWIDGQRISVEAAISQYRPDLAENPTEAQLDSMRQMIGYELTHGENRQPLLDQLFVFDVPLSAGLHQLEVQYHCAPTAYEEGDLRYHVFPYYLGNSHSRQQYDSIFVQVLLPKDLQFNHNFPAKLVNGTLISENLSGFNKMHITVDVYKDIRSKIKWFWNAFMVTTWIIFGLITLALFYLIRRRLDAQKKIWIVYLAYIIPGAIIAGIAFYAGINLYYEYFNNAYGIFLRGSWGYGYMFMVVPIVVFMVHLFWIIAAIFYQYIMYQKKWDITRLIKSKKTS